MIRAGRRHLVRTLADLAEGRSVRLQSYLNARPYAAEGFPAPISSSGSRTLLFDGEQVDAYEAGEPIPELPDTDDLHADDEEDLLDRREAAAVVGVSPRTWDTYKSDPQLAKHMVTVGGVEHWPRGVVHRLQASRINKPTAAGGRPRGAGDRVPREQVREKVAQLLDADPAISAATVVDALHVHRDTAQHALAQLRAERIADLLDADAALTPQQAARRLRYPGGAVRRALVLAEAEQRARAITPYLAAAAQALEEAGWSSSGETPAVQLLLGDMCAAAIVLEPSAPVPALVWDERYGWRTALSRRHPLGPDSGEPPTDEGIRYLAEGTTPAPTDLLAALTTHPIGSERPKPS